MPEDQPDLRETAIETLATKGTPRADALAMVFGTGEDCDVRVDDPYVSTQHCRVIRREDGVVTVEDLGSTNGTWVRSAELQVDPLSLPGIRVLRPTRVRPGMVIRIGRTDIPWT